MKLKMAKIFISCDTLNKQQAKNAPFFVFEITMY